MPTIKAWFAKKIDTPDKARTFFCNVALALGVVGAILMLFAVISATRARGGQPLLPKPAISSRQAS